MEEQVTREVYRRVAWACKESVKKPKTQNEPRLARDAKHNKKAFFKGKKEGKGKNKETIGLQLSENAEILMGAKRRRNCSTPICLTA